MDSETEGMRSLHFEAELRLSPLALVFLFAAMGTLLALASPMATDQAAVRVMAVVSYAFSGLIWFSYNRWPLAGQWTALSTLVVFIMLARCQFPVPGLLALLAIPTALAASVFGVGAMFATSAAETALLFAMFLLCIPDPTELEAVVSLLAIWSAFGVTWHSQHSARSLAEWSEREYMRARGLLEQARDRQAELKTALDALAQAYRELSLLNEKLAATRLIAEEARKSKAAFVANVSHEFRTPLNVIIGLTEVLLDAPTVYGEQLPASVQRDLGILYRNCEHLSTMINDVLDLSRVEADRLALHREWVSMGTLIEESVAIVRPLMDSKDLRLDIILPTSLPLVYCDPVRVRQVILNLISNAARFTEQGSITVEVKVKEPYVITSISDTGPGIAPSDLERVFEPFQQAAFGKRNRGQGSGLGLGISRQLVELHGGRMQAESQLDYGSTFSFELPIAPFGEPNAPPYRWITDGWTRRPAKADVRSARLEERIVLCDDTGEMAPLLARYAPAAEFVGVRDLSEACQALQHSGAQALALNAPTSSRLLSMVEEACSQVPDVPVLGFSLPSQTLPALMSGATRYLLKPLTRTALEKALAEISEPLRRILVVDDEADTLHAMTAMLSALDRSLEVITASTGAQALEGMRREQPDIVLLDIVLDDMSGWQVLDAKAQDAGIRDIPVVLITAQDPRDSPISSPVVVGAMGDGIALGKLLGCCRVLADTLLNVSHAANREVQ